MTPEQRRRLETLTEGKADWNVPMSQRTSLRIGGRAEAVLEVGDLHSLRDVLGFARSEHIPHRVLGACSNLLVRDEGVPGVSIFLKGRLASLCASPLDSSQIVAGAGLPIKRLMRYCLANGLGGLEYLTGIPGTVGGAVAMNAGAFGKEIQSSLAALRILTETGESRVVNADELRFSYRHLDMPPGTIILEADLCVAAASPEALRRRMRALLEERKARLPWHTASAGSVFKNPPGDFAGRLIEDAGLKGERIGGARISEKHGNVIVNTGNATAADVLALIDLARTSVQARSGILLEPEIRILG